MNAPPAASDRVGSWWYRPDNRGRINTQIAAQRWAAWLSRNRQIRRGPLSLVMALSFQIDRLGKCQKSIAFLAGLTRATDRTVQRWLRELAPSKAKDPAGWAKRLVSRTPMHPRADGPGGRVDNVPSWFELHIPAEFFTRKPPASRPPPPPRPAEKSVTPPRQIVTQAVILGSGSVEITTPIHPSTNLARARCTEGASHPPHIPPEPPRKRAAPSPQPPPAGGETPSAVTACQRFFPSHAAIAHRAVARLAALGWSDETIVNYLRKASKDPDFAPEKAEHPLIVAVWRAERNYRQPPPPPRPPPRPAPPGGTAPPRALKPPLTPEERAAMKREVKAKLEQPTKRRGPE